MSVFDQFNINKDNLEKWIFENVIDFEVPISLELIPSGRSNLTFKLSSVNGKSLILRRPPMSHVLKSAHDMNREYKVISALSTVGFPVPTPLAFVSDESIIGAPFLAMEYVDGFILKEAKDVDTIFPNHSVRSDLSKNIIDTLATLHSFDFKEIGLVGFGKEGGYLDRQMKRWHEQFYLSSSEGDKDVSIMEEVFGYLNSKKPNNESISIVHGDYRLDNIIVAGDGSIKAVLDWELSTIGEPLCDLGLFMVYWVEDSNSNPLLLPAPTAMPGLLKKDEMARRYSNLSGRNVDDISYYIAFGYFKLACILKGVLNRYVHGAAAGDPSGAEAFGDQVVSLLEASKMELSK